MHLVDRANHFTRENRQKAARKPPLEFGGFFVFNAS
jgi:hypothetical protein